MGSTSNVGLWVMSPAAMITLGDRLITRAATNTRSIFHPRETYATWHQLTNQERTLHDLPEIRARVGGATVDLLGSENGLIFLNRLNYAPRPVIQGYSAYTALLVRHNRDFLLSPRAPEFLLVRYATIDHRFAPRTTAHSLGNSSATTPSIWRRKVRSCFTE